MRPTFHPRVAAWLGATVLTLAVAGLAVPAQATHTLISLPGSDFEIEASVKVDAGCVDGQKLCARTGGANLKLEDAGDAIDWASVAETRRTETETGNADNSFSQGTKADTAVPTIESGGIPPNKSDLKTFGVYLEDTGAGRFLHLFWHRVQDPSGTTNMDFEFNKSDVLSANGVTPVRTAGDLLIQYDLSNGGTNPNLFVSEWLTTGPGSACEASNATPCWGDRENLTAAGDATGSINSSAIPVGESDSLGAMSARTFGEASVDFDALTSGDGCSPFGSAYLKSRSSDSFTAAMKDFIAPQELDLDICGSITVEKISEGGSGTFDFTSGTLDTDDALDGFSLTTTDSGEAGSDSITFDSLLPGEYDVAETVPTGWDLDDATCDDGSDPAAIQLTPEEDVTCTFTNLGYAKVTVSKVDDDDPTNPVAGAVIRVYEDLAPYGGTEPDAGDLAGPVVAFCTTVAGTCTTQTTLDSGKDYWVVEHSVPAGYFADDPQLIDPDPGEDVAVTFVDARKFTVVTYVCRVADGTLYPSDVTLDGDEKTSWAAPPAGLTVAQLCGVTGGATFGDRQHGVHNGSVEIPQ